MSLENRNDVDLKKYMHLLAKKWLYFIASIFLMIPLYFFVVSLIKPTHLISSTILVKDKNNSVSSNENFDDNLNLFRSKRNLENEISIVKSHETILASVKRTHQNVQYYTKSLLSKKELYNESPFVVVVDSNHIQATNTPFKINFKNDTEFTISSATELCYSKLLTNDSLSEEASFKYNIEGKIGKQIITPYFSFHIEKLPTDNKKDEGNFSFVFQSDNDLATYYQEKIKVEQLGTESSIIKVLIESDIPKKDLQFINYLCETYLQDGIEEKNEIAKRTIKYINVQLESISDSILNLNKNILTYRSGNEIVDVDLQTKYNYEKLSQLEKERAALLAKNKYCKYLKEYINTNAKKGVHANVMAPSTIGVNDPMLDRVLDDMAKLNLEKSSILFSANPSNPNLQMIDLKLDNTLKTLKENVKSILETSQIELDENMANMRPIVRKLSNMPVAEQHLMNISRDYEHFDLLYDYLMKKRAEATIALASTSPHHSLLDKPKISKKPMKPNKKVLLLVFAFLSFMLPGAFIILKETLNPIVHNKEDILANSSIPFLGKIYKSRANKNNQSFNESLNRIVSKLNANTIGNSCTIIGIGSVAEREGKTFIAEKLAMGYAEESQMVLLLELNFRNPELLNFFGIKNQTTINNYFVNECSLANTIIKNGYAGVDVIQAAKSNNPHSLLKNNQLDELFKELRHRYQIIIIDTPAIKSYSDYDFLHKHIDINIFIVSQNITRIKDLIFLNEFVSNEEKKSFFVMNRCIN